MNRILYTMLVLALCFSFAACGIGPYFGATTENQTDAELPDIQGCEELTIKEETHPDGSKITSYRDASGREIRSVIVHPDGSIDDYCYENGICVSMTTMEVDGSVTDRTFHATGALSSMVTTYPDGSYVESCFDENETEISSRKTHADGSYEEYRYESGIAVSSVAVSADGVFVERTHDENGEVSHMTVRGPGEYHHEEWFENGRSLKWISDDPANEVYHEAMYYPNGVLERQYFREGNAVVETRFNEAGQAVYHFVQDGSGTSEHIGDAQGNLVQYIVDGVVYEGDEISDIQIDWFKGLGR